MRKRSADTELNLLLGPAINRLLRSQAAAAGLDIYEFIERSILLHAWLREQADENSMIEIIGADRQHKRLDLR